MPKNDKLEGSAPAKGNAGTQICGLVMPISGFAGHDTQHWVDVRKVLERAISESGMTPQPVWESAVTDIIQGRIIRNLCLNPMVVCDVSELNPNVMFELGVRLAFKKPVVIVADDMTRLPFDTNVIEHLIYPPNLYFPKMVVFIQDLADRIRRVAASVSSGEYQPYLDTFASLEHRATPPRFPGVVDAPVSENRWTDEKLGRLQELWDQGMPASRIADELGGMSRNAVIGKAHRLGLRSRPSPNAIPLKP